MIRPMTAAALCEYSGLTQREVADVLKLRSGAAVSHQIKRLNECMGKDADLRRKYAELSKRIQKYVP